MNPERRQRPRTSSSLPLDLYDPKGRMVVGEGHLINLSEKGALMVSPKPLKPRQAVRIKVATAKISPLELSGRVVWARKAAAGPARGPSGYAYGIQFVER